MADHFAAAAQRHYDDAALLHDQGRLPNADHHFGIAAECALKCVLIQQGCVQVDPPSPDKHPAGRPYGRDVDGKKRSLGHLPGLMSDMALVLHGRTNSRLLADLGALGLDTFTGWDVSDRYLDGVSIQAEDVAKRRTTARRTLDIQQRTHLPGVRP